MLLAELLSNAACSISLLGLCDGIIRKDQLIVILLWDGGDPRAGASVVPGKRLAMFHGAHSTVQLVEGQGLLTDY